MLACGAATYLWRGLGVLLSGRVRADGEVFVWVGCVAYAMVAALIARLVLLPEGTLAATPLGGRLAACAAALLVYYGGRRNLFIGIVSGFGVLVALEWLRGASPW